MDYRANCFFYPEINLTWYSWGQCLVLFVKMMMWEFAVVIISLQNGKERLFTTCTKDIVYAGRHSHFYMDQQAQNPSHQRAFLWKWNIYQRAWNTGKQPKQSLSFKRILGIFFSLYKTILSSILLFCQVVYQILSITMWRYYHIFGVCCKHTRWSCDITTYLPLRDICLIDEAFNVGKGANCIIYAAPFLKSTWARRIFRRFSCR